LRSLCQLPVPNAAVPQRFFKFIVYFLSLHLMNLGRNVWLTNSHTFSRGTSLSNRLLRVVAARIKTSRCLQPLSHEPCVPLLRQQLKPALNYTGRHTPQASARIAPECFVKCPRAGVSVRPVTTAREVWCSVSQRAQAAVLCRAPRTFPKRRRGSPACKRFSKTQPDST
jgi:hypothetical protein